MIQVYTKVCGRLAGTSLNVFPPRNFSKQGVWRSDFLLHGQFQFLGGAFPIDPPCGCSSFSALSAPPRHSRKAPGHNPGHAEGSRIPWIMKSSVEDWDADLSPCNFTTTRFPGERKTRFYHPVMSRPTLYFAEVASL